MNDISLPRPMPALRRADMNLSQELVKPSSALEEAVVAAFVSAFNMDKVSVHDDFFELGGDSLIAEGVATSLSRLLGQPFPMSELYTASTPAEVTRFLEENLAECGNGNAAAAAFARPGAADDGYSTLPLNFGPEDRTVFACCVWLGFVSDYFELAHALNGRAQVTGVRPSQQIEWTEKSSIHQMGEAAARAIAAHPLNGRPRTLVAYSYGGLIAWEAATQLVHMGEPAPSLFLIDPPSEWNTRKSSIKRFRRAAKEQVRQLAKVIRDPAPARPPSGVLDIKKDMRDVTVRSYQPEPMAMERVLLLTRHEEPEAKRRMREEAWRNLAGPALKTQLMDGDHFGMVRGSNALYVADMLMNWMIDGS